MQEPAEKLLKIHQYKNKQVNYINVHEATCPEANRFHRFHVLPVLICSRGMETTSPLLPSGTDTQFSMHVDSDGLSLIDLWASYYKCGLF